MQQGGSQYVVSPEMTPFTGAASNRTHMLLGGGGGVSGGGSDHLQQQQQQQQRKSGDAVSVAEAASTPIMSSRAPPAAVRSSGNFEELAAVSSAGFTDEDALGGEEVEVEERGMSGGNRWPRQETLALLKIRSEMDAAFRDATLKGPIWEEVSRKLAELGYVRSAKKCKEKFENVQKYYKRTKEGRAGRQDGKSYRFFTQLEALHSGTSSSSNPIIPTTATSTPTPTATTLHPIITTAAMTNPVAAPLTSIGIGSNNPMVRIQPTTTTILATTAAATSQIGVPRIGPATSTRMVQAPGTTGAATTLAAGISFSSNTSSSNSSSSSSDSEYDDDEDDLEGGQPSNKDSRKRKRRSSKGGSSSSSRKMMSFFEGLMKQVMEKQDVMQQRFLETIEKREQDRMIREEAWKRQEMARLSREHEIMAKERTISATRDAAIIAFLQKITGQTIQLPPPESIPAAPPPPPPPLPQQSTVVITQPPPPPPPAPPQQHQPQQLQQKQQQQQQQPQLQQSEHTSNEIVIRHHQPQHVSAVEMAVVAVPEQHQLQLPQEMVVTGSGGGGSSFDPTSSRWPKAEVHALIKLRSGLESRYQEAGPKGPLWEEISAGMQKMGYNRNSKRCKEKWENINKYFKKVKESNKRRPEDAKTCPYFHQLDALYRKKVIGGYSGGGGGDGGSSRPPEEQKEDTVVPNATTTTNLSERRSDVLAIMTSPPPTAQTSSDAQPNKSDANTEVVQKTSNRGLAAPSLLQERSSGVEGAATAASVKKPEYTVTELMERQQRQQQSVMDGYDKMGEGDSDNLDDHEDNEDEYEDEEEEDDEEERKMAYKIQFQQQNANSSSGGGNTASSFLAMVQ